MLRHSIRNTPRLFAFSTYTPPKYDGKSYEDVLKDKNDYMFSFYKPYYS